MLKQIQGLQLRALILALFPQVIRDVCFGIRMRATDPAVDALTETHVVYKEAKTL